MQKYKIVVSDLDGTLLNSEHQLSAENAAAMRTLSDKGAFFVPSTGRTLAEITPDISENECVRYISFSNGAVVLDRVSGDKITFTLDNQDVNWLIDVISKYPVHWAVRHNGICYVDATQLNQADYTYYNLTLPHVDCVETYGTPKDNYIEFIRSLDDVEVIALFFHSESDLHECNEIILSTGKYYSAGTCPHNLEIFNKDAGKGHALTALAQKLNIPITECIAIGDSDNDVQMIKTVGLGLATSNAFPEVKSAADEVICSNDEHVLNYVVKKYFD